MTTDNPVGETATCPDIFWDDLIKLDALSLCERAEANLSPTGQIEISVYNTTIGVDLRKRCLLKMKSGAWEPMDDTFLELMVVVYLLNVDLDLPRGDMISVNDLKTAHFFQGPHELRTSMLLQRYGNDPEGLLSAARILGGKVISHGDAGCTLWPLPKIPMHFILWAGDDEFPPAVSILFDSTIEKHLSADAIWGLVNYTTDRLVEAKF